MGKYKEKLKELSILIGKNINIHYTHDYGGFYYLVDKEANNLAFGVDWLDYRLKESDLLGYISGLIVMYEYLNVKK